MHEIIKEAIGKSLSYAEYRTTISQLLRDGKTTGNEQSDSLTHYALMNETRMNRLEKTIEVSDEIADRLSKLKNQYTWLVISEGWCGDSAQLVPIIDKLANVSSNISLRFVFRDENEPLMNIFLTHGSKAIPKLIVLDNDLKVLAEWGPRPKDAADLIKRHKVAKGFIDDEAKNELQLWYLHDKGTSTQEELASIMSELETP